MSISKRMLAQNTRYRTTYYLINGDSKGTTVMITAGVHGSERAGMLAANRFVQLLQKKVIQIHGGRIIIVPIVNQIAAKQRRRGNPDLNRTFPKIGSKTARHPLSAALFRLAMQNKPAWYIDLHEATGLSQKKRGALGQTLIINPSGKAGPAAGKVIAKMNRSIKQNVRHFNLLRHDLPGSGRSAAFHFLKAKAITVETGISLPIQDRVKYQLDILRSILGESGLLKRVASVTPVRKESKPGAAEIVKRVVSVTPALKESKPGAAETVKRVVTPVRKESKPGAAETVKRVVTPVRKESKPGAAEIVKRVVVPARKESKQGAAETVKRVVTPARKESKPGATETVKRVVSVTPARKESKPGEAETVKRVVGPARKESKPGAAETVKRVVSPARKESKPGAAETVKRVVSPPRRDSQGAAESIKHSRTFRAVNKMMIPTVITRQNPVFHPVYGTFLNKSKVRSFGSFGAWWLKGKLR
ncbi:succinylglutamate desuccinylase/aspartoacylase family protein [Paenibacillus sp. NPDC056579]|uniref:succinylglutamate desuccinylase/aspartoacylase family protein n=1 Tax=Paenibacillus sp. NPDC056579 TaxID=3345871 RepID=UPI0036BE489A